MIVQTAPSRFKRIRFPAQVQEKLENKVFSIEKDSVPELFLDFYKVRFTNLRRLLQYGGETLPSGQGLVLVGSCWLVNVGRIFWTQPQWMMEMISSGPIVEECWGCSNLLGGCLPPPSEQDLALFVQRATASRSFLYSKSLALLTGSR